MCMKMYDEYTYSLLSDTKTRCSDFYLFSGRAASTRSSEEQRKLAATEGNEWLRESRRWEKKPTDQSSQFSLLSTSHLTARRHHQPHRHTSTSSTHRSSHSHDSCTPLCRSHSFIGPLDSAASALLCLSCPSHQPVAVPLHSVPAALFLRRYVRISRSPVQPHL